MNSEIGIPAGGPRPAGRGILHAPAAGGRPAATRRTPPPSCLTILLMAILGLALSAVPATRHFYAREGFFAVGLIWLVTGVMGALPFYFSGTFPSFVDCLFESVSGFTTTGATILTDIEAQPRGILFWRAFTHWMGGMGVLVLLTALLPSLGIRSHYLHPSGNPGPGLFQAGPQAVPDLQDPLRDLLRHDTGRGRPAEAGRHASVRLLYPRLLPRRAPAASPTAMPV